jgi:septation ring formation regulator EzrA
MTPQEKQVFSRLFAKTELASHKVELAVTDEISAELKNIKTFLDKANKADAIVQKSVATLNSSYKFFANNQGFAKGRVKVIDGLRNKFEKLGNELGLDVKNSESYKQILTMYDFTSQIDDTLGNMNNAIKSIGK